MTTNDRASRAATDNRPDLSLTGRFVLAIAIATALASLAACAGDDPADVRPYTDTAGRSCNVDRHDISGTASCDVNPTTLTTCDTGLETSFVVNDDYDFDTDVWTLENCVGCIDRAEHTTFIVSATCANIDCETDADCVQDNYLCTSGLCQHM